jgi:Fur family ferric uptake transcriptional regulator
MPDQSDLKKAGLKVTTPRLKILEIFENQAQRHWRAEEIFQQLKTSGDDVGLATVYRVLTQFEAAGLITKHRFDEDHSVYELDRGEHHDHLVCVRCNQVEEFVDPVIEAHQADIARKLGFTVTEHSLTIYGMPDVDKQGVCSRCQRKVSD